MTRRRRMREMLLGKLGFGADLSNVWWGVSVEDRRYGVPRITDLRGAPARTRFLSVEPFHSAIKAAGSDAEE